MTTTLIKTFLLATVLTASAHARDRLRIIFVFLIALLFFSCAGTKEGRRIKRGSGVIRDSKILLMAKYENAVGFQTLTFRENNFFSLYENSMFWWDYYAGTYVIKKDTIRLSYIDGHKRSDLTDIVYIKADTLYMQTINPSKTRQLYVKYNRLIQSEKSVR